MNSPTTYLINVYLQHAEWAMSPLQFERDWPMQILYGKHKGKSFPYWQWGGRGLGTAIDEDAAFKERNKIREGALKKDYVWC